MRPGEKVGEGKEGGLATKLFYHSVGAIELVNKAALIEFFHELSIDQVFRLQSCHGGILQLHQALDVAQAFEGWKVFGPWLEADPHNPASQAPGR
jgi:hypothetical protein